MYGTHSPHTFTQYTVWNTFTSYIHTVHCMEHIHLIHSHSTMYGTHSPHTFTQYNVCPHFSSPVCPTNQSLKHKNSKCSHRKDRTACLMAIKLQCHNWGCAMALSLVASLSLQRPGLDPKPGKFGICGGLQFNFDSIISPTRHNLFLSVFSTNIT
jgi:hypothetical protein